MSDQFYAADKPRPNANEAVDKLGLTDEWKKTVEKARQEEADRKKQGKMST